ncbi:MAG: type II secretion system GspH family protein [Oscillospiraceae bacterium]|nr:type II secretion system GspH family protein [Oscillospiraceae bacterium]
MNGGTSASRFYVRDSGFTTVELAVVVLIIALLTAALFPLMSSLISDARLTSARQDAAVIGAAIELLKVEGRFDPYNAEMGDIYEMIYAKSGARYAGRISELTADGCFVYSLTAGGATYVVRYDASTGSVDEVA